MILFVLNITLNKTIKNTVSVSLYFEEAVNEMKAWTLFSLTLNKTTTCGIFIRNLKRLLTLLLAFT